MQSFTVSTQAADEASVPVSGSVTFNGMPLADGVIVFNLADDEFVGTKIKSGTYKLTRVPGGAWRVSIRRGETAAKNTAAPDAQFQVMVPRKGAVLDFDLKAK